MRSTGGLERSARESAARIRFNPHLAVAKADADGAGGVADEAATQG